MAFPENISSLLSFYKQEQRIYGRCPHCDDVFRLSDVKLTYGKQPPKDLLTTLRKQRDELQSQLDDLEQELEDLESAHEQEMLAAEANWNDRIDVEVDRRTQKHVKLIRKEAIAKSRAIQLGKTLEKVVPMFPGFGHHPYDVRPVFDPIDFVVFDGYFKGEVTDICFVEFKTGSNRVKGVQESIRSAISKKRVHFEEKRLSKESMENLIKGRSPRARRVIKGLLT